MKRSARGQALHILSIVFAALPFAFALIRAIRTGGHDLRYLWVALAALGGAIAAAGLHRRRRNAVATLFAVFLGATLLALVAALLVGTIFGAGVVVVASAFGFCSAAGCQLHILARDHEA